MVGSAGRGSRDFSGAVMRWLLEGSIPSLKGAESDRRMQKDTEAESILMLYGTQFPLMPY